VGSVVTLGLFVIGVTFRMGRHDARIDALEKWRDNIRLDMHEISDQIQGLSKQMTALATLIEERTDRRTSDRHSA
jgi:hypothetical protein